MINNQSETIDFLANFDSTSNPSLKLLDSISAKDLAEKTNQQVRKVRAILKTVKNTDLGRFEVSIDTSRLSCYKGSIEIKSKHPKFNAELTKNLVEIPFVRGVHELAGDDLSHIVTFLIPNMDYFPHWIDQNLIKRFSDKIDYLSTNTSYDLGLKSKNKGVLALDKIDLHISGLLLQNALITLRELSEKVGLSVAAVHKRLDHLWGEEFFEGYNCYIDWDKIHSKGAPHSFICKIKVDYKFLDSVSSSLKFLKFIKIFRTLDKTDFLIFTSVKNIKDYQDVARSIAEIRGVLGVRTYFITQSLGRSKTIVDFYNFSN